MRQQWTSQLRRQLLHNCKIVRRCSSHSPVPSLSTQTYKYLPLKHDHETRLLYLLPGFDEAPLLCSLRIVSLSKLPVYEALSYTWGEPILSASIECSPHGRLSIIENLSAALLRLRLADRIRVLWADAVCINQQDLVERSHQVTLLRDTFERAENIIVWLGEDTGDANEAFEMLRTIDPSSSSDHDIGSLIISDRRKALKKLLERSWFQRSWIVQELVCARKTTIKCGNHSMEWEMFLEVAERIKLARCYGLILDRRVCDALYTLVAMRWERHRRKQGVKGSLELLLYSYRRCLASDPRDKVFALVGIARGQDAAAYTPNYSLDVLEIYRDLAIQCIIAEQSPDFLVHCGYVVGSKLALLPSWVPDWSQRVESNCSPLTDSAYNAAAGTSFKGRVSEDLDGLFLDGVLLNKVQVLGGAWGDSEVLRNDPVKFIKRGIELHEECRNIFRQSPRHRGCYWSAFTRVLVADRDLLGSRIGQLDLSKVYFTYRKYLSRSLLALATQPSFGESAETVEYQEIRDLEFAINHAALFRKFCIFDDGRAGWVPETAEISDRIAIFLGATVPILLRPCGNSYIVLGEAYVHEMMDGQAFEGPDVQIETITLI